MGAVEKKKGAKEEDRMSQAGQCGVAILNTVVRKASPTRYLIQIKSYFGGK